MGIVGAGLTVIDSGKISGGIGGENATRADAIDFTGGSNSLTLLAGYQINGNVVASSTPLDNTLVLGGDANSQFDVSQLVPNIKDSASSRRSAQARGRWSTTPRQ